MKDLGFTPDKSRTVMKQMRKIFKASIDNGFRRPAVRWIMLCAPFSMGASFYAFYAMQPYLLELYGKSGAYGIAGLAAAVIAGAQIIGGLLVKHIRKVFSRRTHAIILSVSLSVVALAIIGGARNLWVAIVLLVLWAMMFAAVTPIRQAYLNGIIPSEQRATVLSFDSLMGSSGGVIAQPALGLVADVGGYSASYLVTAAVQLGALPFAILARREKASSDPI